MYAIAYGATAPDKLTLQADIAANLEVHVSQVDKHWTDGLILPRPFPKNTVIADAVETKITTDPVANHEAAVVAISIVNSHATVTCVVTLRHYINNGAVLKLVYNATMKPGDKLEYAENGVWMHYDQVLGVYTALAIALSQTILLSGSGTYTSLPGCRAAFVRYVAGGGAGGSADGATTSTGAGAGGQSGGWGEKMLSPLAASYAYSVGVGGTPGAAGNTAGGNGADTTFGTLTAKGGTGGGGSGVAGTAVLITQGGGSGIAGTNGDLNAPGDPGGAGIRLSAAVAVSGEGGKTPFGPGGKGNITHLAGNAAPANSGGGGGGALALNTNADLQGGAGGSGVIVITEYF